jgi:broad specificity phosphatase PhoE
VKNIKKSLNAAQDFVIIVSPLRRTWQTMHPFMQDLFDVKTMKNLEKAYDECEALYRDLWDSGNLVKHVHSNKEKNFFHLGENVYVDFRITEPLLPELEWEVDTLVKEWTDQKFSPSGESMIDVYNRLHQFLCETNSLFQTQSVIIASHEDPIMLMIKAHRNFDFVKQHKRYLPSNASVWTHYWDNSRNCEVDLHKPYVDNYWFTLKDRTYKRISEVLDCWFESWSMPYGQVHYLAVNQITNYSILQILSSNDWIKQEDGLGLSTSWGNDWWKKMRSIM